LENDGKINYRWGDESGMTWLAGKSRCVPGKMVELNKGFCYQRTNSGSFKTPGSLPYVIGHTHVAWWDHRFSHPRFTVLV
jgi:hypothetical protein